MLQTSAVEVDPFDKTFGVARLVSRVVEGIFQRRGTDIDNQDFFWSLAFELESVWIITLLKRSVRFRRIGSEHSCPLSNRPGNVPHRTWLGDDGGLKERHRNEQDFAV